MTPQYMKVSVVKVSQAQNWPFRHLADECAADPSSGNCQTKSVIPDRADPFPEKV